MKILWLSGRECSGPGIWGWIWGNGEPGGKDTGEGLIPRVQFHHSGPRKFPFAMTVNLRSRICTWCLWLNDLCWPNGSCLGQQEAGGKDFPQLLFSLILVPSLWKYLQVKQTLVGMTVVLDSWLKQRENGEKYALVWREIYSLVRWHIKKWKKWRETVVLSKWIRIGRRE